MRGLVRLFPQAWRDRYASEFEVLLDDVPMSVPVLVDVVLAATKARVRALGRPGYPLLAALGIAAAILPAYALLVSTVLYRVVGIHELFGDPQPFCGVGRLIAGQAFWADLFERTPYLALIASLVLVPLASARVAGNRLVVDLSIGVRRRFLLLAVLSGVAIVFYNSSTGAPFSGAGGYSLPEICPWPG